MTSESKKKARGAQKGVRQPAQDEQQLVVEAGATPPEKERWHEHASFRVGFYSLGAEGQAAHWQTRAYRDETDSEATWPEIAGLALVDWLYTQGDLPRPAQAAPALKDATERVAQPPQEPPPAKTASDRALESPSAPSPDLRVVGGELDLEEVNINQNGGSTTKLLCARMGFQLAGLYAGPTAATQAHYSAHFTAYNLETGAAVALGSAHTALDPALLDYTIEATFEIPDPGVYQIIGTVVLAANRTAAITVGPRLTVTS